MERYTSLSSHPNDVELGHTEAKTRDLRISPPGLRRASSLSRRKQERTRRIAAGAGVAAVLLLLLWSFGGGRRDERREEFGPPASLVRVGARTGTVPNATTVRFCAPHTELACWPLEACLTRRLREQAT